MAPAAWGKLSRGPLRRRALVRWVLDVDFDGDGLLDAFVKVFASFGSVQLVGIDQLYQVAGSHILQSTNNVFFPQYNGGYVVLDYMVAGDLDLDGHTDFLTTFTAGTLMGGGTALSGYMRPYISTPNGFLEGNAYVLGGATATAAIGDPNENYDSSYPDLPEPLCATPSLVQVPFRSA